MASCEHQAHLDLLDSFGFEQNNHVTVQTEDATIASRIVQPMDYSQKELETNAIGQFGQKMRLKGGKEGERNCDDYFCFIISGT